VWLGHAVTHVEYEHNADRCPRHGLAALPAAAAEHVALRLLDRTVQLHYHAHLTKSIVHSTLRPPPDMLAAGAHHSEFKYVAG